MFTSTTGVHEIQAAVCSETMLLSSQSAERKQLAFLPHFMIWLYSYALKMAHPVTTLKPLDVWANPIYGKQFLLIYMFMC